ncbi:sodium-coupled monocarboxylate transporter 1-like [Clavelina lepadiformis]|uniref:sodium-coupled monocarboxylate transporter 1-like n=1 Tax=Clavelina lepadiformis TaxID=159417 RepID=UPI004041E0FA
MDFSPKTFTVADYVVFALMLSVSTAIGIFYVIKDRKKQNIEEYLLGGRSMSACPVAFSLSVGFMSAVLILGTPSEIYKYGTVFSWTLLGYVWMTIVVAEIYIPTFYNMKLSSVYEYLEKRFNRLIRIEGTLLYFMQTFLYIGIVIYAPALALSSGIVTYSLLEGGLKAVIWTDAFQAIIMLIGFISIIIRGSVVMGGFENIWRACEEGGRIEFLKFDVDPRIRHTAWSLTFGTGFQFLSTYGVNQGQVQRYLSCKSVYEAKKAIFLNSIGLVLLTVLGITCGLITYAYYHNCDPLSYGFVEKPDQLLPYLVLDIFQNYPGMPGLFIACVYSGSLSTVSTAITAMSSVTVQDFLKPTFDWSDETFTWISRGMIIFYGGICILFAYLASSLGQVLQAVISVLGLVGGPLLGLYTLGMLFPFANSVGAFFGANAGLAAAIWLFIGSQNYPPPPKFLDELSYSLAKCPGIENATEPSPIAMIPTLEKTTPVMPPEVNMYAFSYQLYTMFGFFWTIGIGLLASFLTCGWRDRKTVDPRLIYPFFDHWIFKCLPEYFKKRSRCGVKRQASYNGDGEGNKLMLEKRETTKSRSL